jgi:hypothetical protein
MKIYHLATLVIICNASTPCRKKTTTCGTCGRPTKPSFHKQCNLAITILSPSNGTVAFFLPEVFFLEKEKPPFKKSVRKKGGKWSFSVHR